MTLIANIIVSISLIWFTWRISALERQISMIREENHLIISVVASEQVEEVLRQMHEGDSHG